MHPETAEYLLSCYPVEQTLKDTPQCCVQVVRNTLDGKRYVKKTYPNAKERVFALLQKIDSEHIPSIVEIIPWQGTVVIEEYILGQTLREKLDTHSLHGKQVRRLAQQLFQVLDTLHQNHIIHRDVKPENIILDEQENLWLIDFDIARQYQPQQEQDTQSFGTVGYAPPEQYGFSQTDARADLYAAGVTLEEMCRAGGCSSLTLVAKVAKRCRAFDPNQRYPSAKEALRHLRRGKQAGVGAGILLLLAVLFLFWNMFLPWIGQEGIMETPYQAYSKEETWVPIVKLDTQKEDTYLPLVEKQKEYAGAWLAGKEGTLQVSAFLQEDALSLRLEDGEGRQEKLLLQHLSPLPPDYVGTSLEGELIFLDINQDGTQELLIVLSHRKRLLDGEKAGLCNTNWRAMWCVGYTVHQGFAWEEQAIVTYGNHDTIVVHPLGGGEIRAGDTYYQWTGKALKPLI